MKTYATPLGDFDSLYQLMEFLKTEKVAIQYLQYQRWQGLPSCPHCSCAHVYTYADGIHFKCSSCRQSFTVRIGTIFENSKLPIRKWIIATYLILNHKTGISSYQLARDIDVTQKTAWFMLHRIRFGIAGNDNQEMDGRVELDESFVGGKNRNRHADKKVANSQGRSFKDKQPVMGMLQEGAHQIIERPHKVIPLKTVREKVIIQPSIVRCRVVPDTKGETLQPIIHQHIKAGAVIISDEWMGYHGLGATYDHRIVDHRAKQYVNAAGDTSNAIEGFWQGLKLSHVAIYRHYSRKHTPAYVAESEFRYNTRRMSDGERVKFALSLFNKTLSYKQLTKKTAA